MNERRNTSDIEAWIDRYTGELFHWALARLKDRSTAEDLVQDTFETALRKSRAFRGESSPKTWLIAILNNKITDHFRGAARLGRSYGTDAEDLYGRAFDANGKWAVNDPWGNEEELLDNTDFNDALQACLSRLPESWRLAITWKFLSSKNTADICQDLGITTSNYWQIVHRAKIALKECLNMSWFGRQRNH